MGTIGNVSLVTPQDRKEIFRTRSSGKQSYEKELSPASSALVEQSPQANRL
jgi:hypothetical protein